MRTLSFAMFSQIVLITEAAGHDASICMSIENDLDRLSCYDEFLGREPIVTEHQSESAWKVRTDVSEFKDTTDVYLSVESSETVTCGFSGAKRIALIARCVEDTTSLLIASHCHVASEFGGYGDVEYRIDQDRTKTMHFTESTNSKALGLWNGSLAIPVIRSMIGADEMLIRFTPYNENSVTAKFQIAGLEDVIDPLRQHCNW